MARRVVREVLTLTRREDLVDIAQLLVSEVVTNALVHAGTPIRLEAFAQDSGLRVEVADGSTQRPALRTYGVMAGTGRGLRLLEQLVDRWGTLLHEDGKTVWFELSSDRRDSFASQLPLDAAEGTSDDGESHQSVVDVTLLSAPLLLLAAWLQHAEGLLREYLLARLEEDDATGVLEMHAAASGAMSLLHEQIPTPDLGTDPGTLMAAAIEPYVSARRLQLRLPQNSIRRFRVLDETLDSALTMADSGELLTPPIQPEVRELRRWLCGEVRRQARGEPPTPWFFDADAAPPPVRPRAPWQDDVTDEPVRALIAADDTGRIRAASRPACDLLGYRDADELVAQRLIAIIPSRYRQAHLAGFTLHLISGRKPFLGKAVSVPALRRDGTEITVELIVQPHRTSAGRYLFIAEFDKR